MAEKKTDALATASLPFKPREMMEKAIEAMRKSVSEPRKDGKASPLVGVAIWKPDGTIETAHRGELRFGDHAEFTLLERKNRDKKLDGSFLFTTLEPCAPGSRREPKLSCAERIVLARVKKVWIGLEDPDPTVDRKGITYLLDNDVEVDIFDRDLQGIITTENRDFIDQAMERKAAHAAQKKSKLVKLSELEDPIVTVDAGELSGEALERYRSTAKITDLVDSPSFRKRLLQQGLLKEDNDGHLNPTGFGCLLFGTKPRDVLPQAGLLATIHHANGQEELRDFDGPIVLIPELVEKWLKDKLPDIADRGQMRRKQGPDIPLELVREAVVNALVHRDYAIAGAKCQLSITRDTITISSPGGPIAPITLRQLQEFNAPMLSRNPQLHYVFARMELAEERGLGMQSMRSVSQQHGLPLPKYFLEDPYLRLVLYRSPESAVHALPKSFLEELNSAELKGWEFLASKISATMAEYAQHMGFDVRKAQRHLKRFVELGLLSRVGRGPATEYVVQGQAPAEASVTAPVQPRTRFQKFKAFLDVKISQANGIKRGISPENRKTQIGVTKDWIDNVAKAIHIAFGGKARNDFVNYSPFTGQIFYGETMGGLEQSIDKHLAYLERLKKDRTAAELLPDFDPEDLKDYE
ncbi:MAG: hypothetical protein NTY77_16040 [Elusimicrobia bacterium]|nr:hypothetical protein [Elusimicrobiota bacterium]